MISSIKKRAEKEGLESTGIERPWIFAGDRGSARAGKPRWLNFSDYGSLQDGGDNFHIPAAMRAMFDVDIEYPF